ncbi:MAG TPA: inorganic phosphate transporter [Vicinamibacterales bacterium]
MSVLILAAVVLLAYSNGANDNFKGVATLFGSGTADYRRALTWATVTTFAGSMLALALASGLVATFSGRDLVPDAVSTEPAFLTAVSLGAALTVLLATQFGLPVSTTHALTGALLGAGAVATQGQVRLDTLGSSFVLPLAFSPVISVLITLVLYPLFKVARRLSGVTAMTCVPVGSQVEEVIVGADGTLAFRGSGDVLETGHASNCVQRYRGHMLGIEAGPLLDSLHYLSAGAVGFARGLNDTPKIVALLIAAQTVTPNVGLALVAVVMALGGILNARRVAETMSRKITQMNPGQGFTANLVTSLLVTTASRFGLPVSTTQVSVGSLFGIGVVNGTANRRMIAAILLAWVTTLPLAALLGAAVYWTRFLS